MQSNQSLLYLRAALLCVNLMGSVGISISWSPTRACHGFWASAGSKQGEGLGAFAFRPLLSV